MCKVKRDHDKRKTVICSRCNESKLNFGLGMCSACLRRTKRETRPRFYLGTCFSEMSRRVSTYCSIRPNYYGLDICGRDEFKDKFENDDDFLRLYKGWQESGFQRRHSPSIDRIDNSKGYILDNLQFISQTDNSGKDSGNKIKLISDFGCITIFSSQISVAKHLGISREKLIQCLKLGCYGDYKIERVEK